MTQFNWPFEIVRNCHWKELAAKADPENLSPWRAPKLAAKPDAIAAAEAAVGFEFPEAYRGFLRHTDGWNDVYMSLSFFGTADFVSGAAMKVLERPEVALAMEKMHFRIGQYVPIGAADPAEDPDVFILVRPDNPVLAGGVVWLEPYSTEGETDHFASFEEFFVAIIEHNEAVARYALTRTKT